MPADFEYSIRKADLEDIDSIYEIEQNAFKNPWSMAGFYNEFDVSFSDIIVAEHEKEVIGFAILWLVRDELHLHKIAVSGDYRRCGIAKSFIDHYIRKYRENGATVIFLEVREKNTGAREFYKALGFQETGIRKDYYPDDNAVLIKKDI